MSESEAEWFDVDQEWGNPGAPSTEPPVWNPRTIQPPHPHTAPPHDAADRLPSPTDSGSSTTTILALSIGGVLAVVLVLLLVYMFVLRKKYNSVKTQQTAAEYQVRIEDAVHVINNMDETCNTYANTTDLQMLVNTVRARGKSQDPLPLPPRLQKPVHSTPPSSENINNVFTHDQNLAVRPPKPTPSLHKPQLVPPYETVVLNPESDSKEPKFIIQSSITTTSISPIARPKIESLKAPSTSTGIPATAVRPAPPPPINAATAPKPLLPKNSKPSQPTLPTNQKPFTLTPSTNLKPSVIPPNQLSNLNSSTIAPQTYPKPKVPSNIKPSPLLPPTHTRPAPVVPTANFTSSNSSAQNKILSTVKKGKLPLLPPLKTGMKPSLSRDVSYDTPETTTVDLSPDYEHAPAPASISAKIAFLEGKMKM